MSPDRLAIRNATSHSYAYLIKLPAVSRVQAGEETEEPVTAGFSHHRCREDPPDVTTISSLGNFRPYDPIGNVLHGPNVPIRRRQES